MGWSLAKSSVEPVALPSEPPPIVQSAPSVRDELVELLRLVHSDGRPNVNALNELLRDMQAMKFNLKFFGYELAKRVAETLPPMASGGACRIDLQSKASTQADLEADWSRHWSSELKISHVFHRKIWELAFVLQTIWQMGGMQSGKSGIGFGCGEEPIASYLAARGCRVTVTDLPLSDARTAGWAATQQLASLDRAFRAELVSRETFDANVDFHAVDMTALPDNLGLYDFCWSICAFEHLGSIENGIRFVENAIDMLRPGGFCVHTTEFNFLNDAETIDNAGTVLFQKAHFEEIARRLQAKGCTLAPLCFDIGSKPLDKFIDVPPYSHDWNFDQAEAWSANISHLKLTTDGFPVTCFGIIACKA